VPLFNLRLRLALHEQVLRSTQMHLIDTPLGLRIFES